MKPMSADTLSGQLLGVSLAYLFFVIFDLILVGTFDKLWFFIYFDMMFLFIILIHKIHSDVLELEEEKNK